MYRKLVRTPTAFRSLTGVSVAEFDALHREWSEADRHARATATRTREGGRPRQRAPGAGRRPKLEGRTRLLLALVWLKVYPTWEVLGYLFGVDERTARRTTADVLAVLETLAVFPLERRPGGRHGRNLERLVEAHPVVEVLIDSREQRIRRPKGWQKQKPFYSGKKKAHTLKSQATVSLEGRTQALSVSVPGATSDLSLLSQSGVVERLLPSEAAGLDQGYIGVEKRYPTHAFYLPVKRPPRGELGESEKSYNRSLASVRIIVEHLFARLSRFGGLAQVFRHRRERHASIFRVVTWIVDRQIEALLARTAPA